MFNRSSLRLFSVAALALSLLSAGYPQPVEAGCGCQKKPPAPAAIFPHATYSGRPVTLVQADLQSGQLYTVTFTSGVTGETATAEGQAVTKRDISDGQYKPILTVSLPELPLGPTSVSVSMAGQGGALLALPDDALTVVSQPVFMPAWEQTFTQKDMVAAVGRDGTVYLSLDLSLVDLPMTFQVQTKKYPLRFSAKDVVFYNAEGYLMQVLDEGIPGLFVVDTGVKKEDSHVLQYARHEFSTYFLQHAERKFHALDATDANWHLDGTRHIDHNHLIVAIAGYLQGTGHNPSANAPYNALPRTDAFPVPGVTLPFELEIKALSIFSDGLVGSQGVQVEDQTWVESDIVSKQTVALQGTSLIHGTISGETVNVDGQTNVQGTIIGNNAVTVRGGATVSKKIQSNGQITLSQQASLYGAAEGYQMSLDDKSVVYGEVTGYQVHVSPSAKVLSKNGVDPGKITSGKFKQVVITSKEQLSVYLPKEIVSQGDLVIQKGETYTLTGPATFLFSSLTVKDGGVLSIDNTQGPVTLYLTGPVSTAPTSTLQFSTENSDGFAFYVTGGNVFLAGQGTFHGVLYAPESKIEMSGAGRYVGAVIGKSVRLSGQASLVFDEKLGDNRQQQDRLKAASAAAQLAIKADQASSKAFTTTQQAMTKGVTDAGKAVTKALATAQKSLTTATEAAAAAAQAVQTAKDAKAAGNTKGVSAAAQTADKAAQNAAKAAQAAADAIAKTQASNASLAAKAETDAGKAATQARTAALAATDAASIAADLGVEFLTNAAMTAAQNATARAEAAAAIAATAARDILAAVAPSMANAQAVAQAAASAAAQAAASAAQAAEINS